MPSKMTGPAAKGLQVLAIPFVVLLISFLGYYSQYVFNTADNLGAGPLSTLQSAVFNVLLLCVWWTYYKACTVDPGSYPALPAATATATKAGGAHATSRWCKKCSAPKPPRAHHCRHCGRCIPKMDHHCPWTGTCVSLQTFPHFLRFLAYANLALADLHYLVFLRANALWADRHLPAYLGPTLASLVSVAVLALLAAGTSLALSILLATTTRSFLFNTTMIEGWELERHEALVDRYARDPDPYSDVPVVRQVEFPYDLGFYANMAQAMGTDNCLAWLWPFASSGPKVSPDGAGVGWEWEENGFNPRKGMWPPVDPDKARRARVGWPGRRPGAGGGVPEEYASPEEAKRAFLRRQREDLARRSGGAGAGAGGGRFRSGIVAELEEEEDLYEVEYDGYGGYKDDRYGRAYKEEEEEEEEEEGMDGEPGWTNSDGDRLRDYGVDEEVEDEVVVLDGDDDDDVPIAELLRRRKGFGAAMR